MHRLLFLVLFIIACNEQEEERHAKDCPREEMKEYAEECIQRIPVPTKKDRKACRKEAYDVICRKAGE